MDKDKIRQKAYKDLHKLMVNTIKSGRLAFKKFNPDSDMALVYYGRVHVAHLVLGHLKAMRRGAL